MIGSSANVTTVDRSARSARSPVVRPGGARLRGMVGRLVVAAVMLVTWQVVGTLWLPPYLPSPWGVVGAVAPTVTDAEFLRALRVTLGTVVLGLLIGCVAGTAAGLLIGRLRWLRSLTAVYVNGLYAMPMLAIVPMVTIWLGYTGEARLTVIASSAFLPCVVNGGDGARALPAQLVDVARVLRIGPRRFLTDLVLPAALSFVVAGIQVAVGRALVGTVAVEFLTSVDGLGTFILTTARSFQQDRAFVAVLVLAAFGVLARGGVGLLLRRLAPWESTFR